MRSTKMLGEMLIEAGLLTPAQLDQALHLGGATGLLGDDARARQVGMGLEAARREVGAIGNLHLAPRRDVGQLQVGHALLQSLNQTSAR